jgi:hypothetical protein
LGTFNYTVSIGGCVPRTFSGQIISQGSLLSLTSSASTSSQTLCRGNLITPITYSATGTFTSIAATGLPAGVNAVYNAGTLTISGTPSQAGVFNYNVNTTGGSCNVALTGTLTVNDIPATVITPTATVLNCANQTITLVASGGSTYLWSGGLGTLPSVSVSNAGTYSVTATSALGCVGTLTNITITSTIPANTITWLGISTDWNNNSNWCGGVPALNKDIIIPSGLSFYPVINSSVAVNSITIQSGATFIINQLGSIAVGGNFNNSGTLTNNGKIQLNGILQQTFPGTGLITAMDTLQINNPTSVVLNKSFDINKELRPSQGTLVLGDFDVTLKSNALSTACIAATGINAGFSYGTGRFIIERYVPTGTGVGQHGKSWQFLTAPVKGTQTVKQSWQENATYPNQNLNPGFGTQITGSGSSALSLGFDGVTFSTSMKTYDAATNTFVGIPNTNAYPIQNNLGYMVYMRGNRNDTAYNQAAEPATLRARGTVYTKGADAPPVTSIGAGLYQSVANPFASTIDFANTSGVVFDRGVSIDNSFYVWDPTNTGLNGFGGYHTLSATNNWRPVPGGTLNYPTGVTNSKIQSGQAFFMHATGAGGTVSINEGAKISGSAIVYRPTTSISNTANDKQFFETKLYYNTGTQLKLMDANVAVMSDDYSNEYNADDALKMSNGWETISLLRNGKLLSVEAKSHLTESDTLFFNTAYLKTANYKLQFIPDNMMGANVVPYLIDKHLQTTTALSLSDTSNIDFSAVVNTASAASDRFMVVFRLSTLLPVTFTNVTAWRKEAKKNMVTWTVSNEINIQSYVLERSVDGRHFEKIADIAVHQSNGNNANYFYEDLNCSTADLFYRVKALEQQGNYNYSQIVKVKGLSDKTLFSINPNPVKNKTIKMQYANIVDGSYDISLYNSKGEKVLNRLIDIHTANNTIEIALPDAVSAGVYIIKISKGEGVVFQDKVMVL